MPQYGLLSPLWQRCHHATMYCPAPFAESNPQALQNFIAENALGMLVSHSSQGLDANHLPWLWDAGVLLAHVARANPIWQELRDGAEVLVVFRGAEGYISPNWYPGKQATHRRVPTWNYEVVHAHGTLHVHEEPQFIRRVLALLTRQHEAKQSTPWKMGDAPKDFLEEKLQQVIGLEVRVQRWEGKRKLNQHHSTPDRAGAIQGLQSQGQDRLAQAMAAAAPHTE